MGTDETSSSLEKNKTSNAKAEKSLFVSCNQIPLRYNTRHKLLTLYGTIVSLGGLSAIRIMVPCHVMQNNFVFHSCNVSMMQLHLFLVLITEQMQ